MQQGRHRSFPWRQVLLHPCAKLPNQVWSQGFSRQECHMSHAGLTPSPSSYYSPQWFSLYQIANVGVHSCIISKNCQERDCMQENWTNQLSNESKRTLWHNGKKRPDTVESARGGWTVTLATTPRPLSSLLWGLSAPSSHLLPIHNTQNYLLQATISNCRTFQIPWMSTNPCITMRLTNHPPCWCSQTIPTSLPAFLPTTTDRLFPP